MKKYILQVVIAIGLLFPSIAIAGVRLAIEYNIHPMAAFVGMEKGIFQKNGVNIDSYKIYRTGMQLIAATLREDADITFMCLTPAIIAFSRGAKIKILALTHLYGYGFVGRPEIKSIRELNGKTIGTMKMGSPLDLLYHIVKERYHLHVKVRRMSPLKLLIALERGDLSATFLSEPFATIATEKGFPFLTPIQKIWPNMNGSVVVARNNFIKKHPREVKKFIKALVKATIYINKHPKATAECAHKYIKVPPDIILKAMKHMAYKNRIDIKQVEKTIALLRKLHYIEKPVRLNELLLRESLH